MTPRTRVIGVNHKLAMMYDVGLFGGNAMARRHPILLQPTAQRIRDQERGRGPNGRDGSLTNISSGERVEHLVPRSPGVSRQD